MKTKITTILSLVLVLLANNALSAQTTLTLEQCRNQAIEYNKQLKQAALKKEETNAYKKAARTAYLPSLEASATAIYSPREIDLSVPGGFLPTAGSLEAAEAGQFNGISNVYSPGMNFHLDNITAYTGGISLTQPIFTGGKIFYSNKKADLGVQMAENGYQLKYHEVIELTDQAFWQVAMVKANIEIAEAYIKMLGDLKETMTDMYNVGIKPVSEKLKVSVQKNEAELNLLKAKNGLTISKIYLKQVLGMDLNSEIDIDYQLDDILLPETQSGIQMALNNRNELQLMQKQVQMAEYEKKVIRADYLPTVGVSARYSTFNLEGITDELAFHPILMGQVSIPLFKWGQGKQKQKAAQLVIQQKQEELSHTTDLISLQVMQTEVKLQEAFEAIKIAEKSEAVAKESLSETEASFEAGLNTTTELLNAQADWQKAKSNLINSKAQYKVLETQWEKAIGQLSMNND